MSEMVDRVARAIYAGYGGDRWDAITDSAYASYPTQKDYRIAARAAIGAMREPTEKMRDEGVEFLHELSNCNGPNEMASAYRKMIDTALKD